MNHLITDKSGSSQFRTRTQRARVIHCELTWSDKVIHITRRKYRWFLSWTFNHNNLNNGQNRHQIWALFLEPFCCACDQGCVKLWSRPFVFILKCQQPVQQAHVAADCHKLWCVLTSCYEVYFCVIYKTFLMTVVVYAPLRSFSKHMSHRPKGRMENDLSSLHALSGRNHSCGTMCQCHLPAVSCINFMKFIFVFRYLNGIHIHSVISMVTAY